MDRGKREKSGDTLQTWNTDCKKSLFSSSGLERLTSP